MAGNDLISRRTSIMHSQRGLLRVFAFEVGGRVTYVEDAEARGLAKEILAILLREEIEARTP